MTLKELLAGLDILSSSADLNTDIHEVQYDSRLVEPGDLFIAVPGAAADGHKFIPMAREKGAACVLCEKIPEGDVPSCRWPTPAGRWRWWAATALTIPPES